MQQTTGGGPSMNNDTRKPDQTERITESDLSQDIMGRNNLQGDDQDNVRNERRAVPDEKTETDDDIRESLEKLDKDVRAREDLGKGNRSSSTD
jgi:hypothetical protein